MGTTTTTTYIKQSIYTTAVTSSLTLSPSTQVHSTDEVDATLYVSIGVSGAVVVVIATAVIGICVCTIMYLRKRQVKLVNISVTDTTDNVAYGTSKNEMKLSCNVAYSTTKSASSKDENTYDYVPATVSTTDGNDIITILLQMRPMQQLKELVSKVKIHMTIYLPLMEMTSLLLLQMRPMQLLIMSLCPVTRPMEWYITDLFM